MTHTNAEIIKAAQKYILGKWEGHLIEYTIEDCFEEDEIYGNPDVTEPYLYKVIENVNVQDSGRLESFDPPNSNICICWVQIDYEITTQYCNSSDENDDKYTEEALLIVFLDKRDLGVWTHKDYGNDFETIYIQENEEEETVTEINLSENAVIDTIRLQQTPNTLFFRDNEQKSEQSYYPPFMPEDPTMPTNYECGPVADHYFASPGQIERYKAEKPDWDKWGMGNGEWGTGNWQKGDGLA
jgi:hypothetical protein